MPSLAIMLFTSGAVVGLLSFSHLLKWLFKNYHNLTLALLTGFIFGSLNKIWPWKATEAVMETESGVISSFQELSTLGTLSVYQKQIGDFESHKVLSELSILPTKYSEINNLIDPQTLPAILLMIFGFLTIFILERLGKKS